MSKKNNLVSIIIPTYNRAQRLKESLKSVINQTYKTLEILVIDDGSIDNTKEIVKSFKDKRIKYYYKKNRGPTDSRNYGLKNSKGKYIAFLDDDDKYHQAKIEEEVKFLNKHDKCGFCYCNYMIGKEGKLQPLIKKVKDNNFIDLLLDGTGTYISTITIMLRRKVVKQVGYFNQTFEPVEDYDYWLRCARLFSFGYIDKVLATAYIHDANITGNPSYLLEATSKVRLSHLVNLKKSDVPKKYLKKYNWEINFHQGRVLYYKNEYKKALPYFIKAIKTNWTKITAYIFLLQSLVGGGVIVKTTYRIYMYLKFR